MPQFKVPQNLDMEDRIIGHFTFAQFGYLAFGAMLAYVLLIKIPGVFGLLLALPIAIFFFALAAVKVQDQPMPKFLISLVKYLAAPRNRIWQREQSTSAKIIVADRKKKQATAPHKKNYTAGEIGRVAAQLDSRGYAKQEPKINDDQ